MRLVHHPPTKQIAAAVAIAWLAVGLVLAFTWARWFVPTLPVVVGAGLLGAAASSLLLRRSPALSTMGGLGRVGVIAMGAVFFWFGFAMSLPALANWAVGIRQSASARVTSYSYGSYSCGFRLVVDALSPPGGGFCRAGDDGEAFRPGEVIEISMRSSQLGVHVVGFSKVRANNSIDTDVLSAGFARLLSAGHLQR